MIRQLQLLLFHCLTQKRVSRQKSFVIKKAWIVNQVYWERGGSRHIRTSQKLLRKKKECPKESNFLFVWQVVHQWTKLIQCHNKYVRNTIWNPFSSSWKAPGVEVPRIRKPNFLGPRNPLFNADGLLLALVHFQRTRLNKDLLIGLVTRPFFATASQLQFWCLVLKWICRQ